MKQNSATAGLFGSTLNDFQIDSVDRIPESPVLILYQINIWSGTETETTLSETDGENRLVRRRIVPRDLLKSFQDIRGQAKKLCSLYGEPYLGGFAVAQEKASEVLSGLKVLRSLFLEERDQRFLNSYRKIREAKSEGLKILDCSADAVCPSELYVLKRLRFEYQAFSLEATDGFSTFMESFRNSSAVEAEELALLCEGDTISDTVRRRAKDLAKRLFAWRAFDQTVEKTAAELAAFLGKASANGAVLKTALENAAHELSSFEQSEDDDTAPQAPLEPLVSLASEAAPESPDCHVVGDAAQAPAEAAERPGEKERISSEDADAAPLESISPEPDVQGWSSNDHPILRRSLFFA